MGKKIIQETVLVDLGITGTTMMDFSKDFRTIKGNSEMTIEILRHSKSPNEGAYIDSVLIEEDRVKLFAWAMMESYVKYYLKKDVKITIKEL